MNHKPFALTSGLCLLIGAACTSRPERGEQAADVGPSSYCDEQQISDVGAIYAKPFAQPSAQSLAASPMPLASVGVTGLTGYIDPKNLPVAGAAFATEPQFRQRAAIVCACRAKKNRNEARGKGAWADWLTLFGVLGTVGGGVIAGLAVKINEQKRRDLLGSAGSVLIGIGSVSFGISASLGLQRRSAEFDSAAEDQEYATAVLWNDNAARHSWDRAWAACVRGESLVSGVRAQDLARQSPAPATSEPPIEPTREPPAPVDSATMKRSTIAEDIGQ